MNLIARTFAAALFAAILTGGSLAQSPPTQPTREDIMRDNLEQRMNNMRNLDTLARRQAELERAKEPKARYYRPEMTKDLERRLEISDSFMARYGPFLSKPGTGIIRLIEQADCSAIKKESKAAECYQENANIREFANAFSFRARERVHFGSSDVAMAKGHIVGGRRSVQTILVAIDDAELENAGPETPELAYLFDFRPAEDAAGMDAQFEDLRAGMSVANFGAEGLSKKTTYSKTARIELGGIYALRAIGYRSAALAGGDKDSDVVIVFKVVEADGRGGVTLLWREVARKPGVVMKEEAAEPTDGK